MKTCFASLLACLLSFTVAAQAPFSISLNPIEIPEVGGVQSFALGQYEGKWLVVGGRLDGLHQRQPWASFDAAGRNDVLTVVDPESMQSWTAATDGLDAGLRDQLLATNMQSFQAGNVLYLLGGYGYSDLVEDHITHPFLTAIDLAGLVEAIVAEEEIAAFFRRVEDEQFAVTGGYLQRLGDTFYLLGGHRFDGRYNPMNMPSFTQEYTDAVRRFQIEDNGSEITITHLDPWTSAADFHRRDFNVVPQIMPDGSEGLTAFSGVFQVGSDIPFLDCVNLSEEGYALQANFSQYYNHYHCAHVALYSSDQNEMHNLFFGGIAQYYEEDGLLVMDDEVPFVKTIARVTRSQDGSMAEYKLPIEMPAFLGAGAVFIPLESMDQFPNGVIDFDALEGENILLGYIYGGIESSEKNVFWINDGTQSSANEVIYEVYLQPSQVDSADEINLQSDSPMRMQLYADTQTGNIHINLMMSIPADLTIEVFDLQGRLVEQQAFGQDSVRAGENELLIGIPNLAYGQTYIVTARSSASMVTQKMILNE